MNTIATPADAGTTLERSDLEIMIGESVQRLFSDHMSHAVIQSADGGQWPSALWVLVEDNGLPMALCAGDKGGSDAQWADVYPVFAGIGQWSVPLPLAETMIAAGLLGMAGVDVPTGPMTVAHAGKVLLSGGNTTVLSGVLQVVPWARACGFVLVGVTGSAQLALVDLRGVGVTVTPGTNMAGEPRDGVALDRAPVVALFDNPIPHIEQPLLVLGALARCAMLTGALERALELAVKYTNERVQFGRPLSKNQVVQHGLAMVASEVVAAKVATRVAFASLQADAQTATTPFDVAVAKVRAGQAAAKLAAVAHQFHGAIGFTQEHVLHQSTRRLWSWRQEFGSDATWARALGRAAIAKGAAGFWPAMTERSLQLALSESR